MMAAIVFVVSLAALLQFFISYCRSLIAATARVAISEEVREVAGLVSPAQGWDYARVRQLLQLCPERPDDRTPIRAVSGYYRLLSLFQWTPAFAPKLRKWAEAQRCLCTYFAAVTLDRRIAFSREMFSNQMNDSY
jgi:hypothetical protein